MDKSSAAQNKDSVFRIEVWTKFNSEQDEAGQNIRKYIEETYIKGICQNDEDKDEKFQLSKICFAVHKKQEKTDAQGSKQGGNRGPQK